MSKPPRVSVLLPVYNGEATLGAALESLFAQTFVDFEILAVDDGSMDGTPAVLESFRDPRLRVIRLSRRQGRSRARNIALAEAQGELVAMMDADDLAGPRRLEAQVAHFDRRPETALCGSWAEVREPSGRRYEWRQPTSWEDIRGGMLRSCAFIHSTVMARRDVLLEQGGFDEKLEIAEDYDLYLKIARRYPVANLPEVLLSYRAHGGALYSFREQWNNLRVKARALFRYGYPLRQSAYLAWPLVAGLLPKSWKIRLKSRLGGSGRMGPSSGKLRVFQVLECGSLSGCGRLVASISNALDRSRFEVTLVYAARPDTSPADFEALFASDIRKIRVPMVRPVSPPQDLRSLLALLRLFREERPDVVHLHSSKAGFLGRLAALAAGVPRVFYSPHGYSFRMTDSPPVARFLYFLAELALAPIGRTVVNAPNELEIARRLAGAGRVLAAYNGIDASVLEPSYASGPALNPLIAACGRITTAKDPQAFLKLCARLSKDRPQARFLWIGGGDEGAELEFLREGERLGLGGRLALTGWLSRGEALKRLASADVFVHYSLWDVLPTAALEAMALGKPVVGSAAVDQIEHGETGYRAGNEDELLEFTRRLADSWEEGRRMGEAGRRLVEREYSLERLVAQLERAYRGLAPAVLSPGDLNGHGSSGAVDAEVEDAV